MPVPLHGFPFFPEHLDFQGSLGKGNSGSHSTVNKSRITLGVPGEYPCSSCSLVKVGGLVWVQWDASPGLANGCSLYGGRWVGGGLLQGPWGGAPRVRPAGRLTGANQLLFLKALLLCTLVQV